MDGSHCKIGGIYQSADYAHGNYNKVICVNINTVLYKYIYEYIHGKHL